MKPTKRKKLEAAGFKVGTVQEFLGLSDEEMALIDLKVRLVGMLKTVREARGITQHQLAKLMSSSQSRVAKLEGAAAEASLDLICRALFALGVNNRDLGKMIASKMAA
ncbi:MAG TPA: helix-turn-helix transcriptional regulator [Phycisphaerae bacterium]|nr:helix-turn-helix transcriptional regulator [Phycisphaerae bacterium]